MEGSSSVVLDEPVVKTTPKDKPKSKILPPFHVILLNDDDHTPQYVIEMLKVVFGYAEEKGQKFAKEVHEKKKAIVWTGSKELGELKQEQVHAFGPDKLVPRCKGSMTCILEPSA